MECSVNRLLLSLLLLFASVSLCHGEVAATDARTPGVALAEGITEITGVAISPLLGVSVVGSWTWFHTPEEARAGLAWYCQPWAWGFGFCVLALCFAKDSLGAAAPGLLKKPFDLAELLENQASALVASVGFVPLVAAEVARAMKPVEVPAASLNSGFIAMIDPAWITVPLALVGFAIVWVCSHAINVLIILSPFSLVDTLLKISRTALLAMVAVAFAIAPWLGAAVCLVILAVAIRMAPAALRLGLFGSRVAGDLVFSGRARRRASIERPHVFTLGAFDGLPRRTGGSLFATGEGGLGFRFRRFLFGPERVVNLPPGRHEIAKGLLMPVLLRIGENGVTGKLMILLPRYRGREEEIRVEFGFAAVREHAWTRGRAAAKEWWRSITARQAVQ
jgi:hypothetical protein